MKSLLIIVLLHFYLASALPTNFDMDQFMGFVTICRNKESADETDVKDIINRLIPTTKIGKCFNACMMEQYKIIVDGKYDAEAITNVFKSNGEKNEKATNLLKDFVNDCKSIIDSDRCELSLKIKQCFENTVKERGISVTDLIVK